MRTLTALAAASGAAAVLLAACTSTGTGPAAPTASTPPTAASSAASASTPNAADWPTYHGDLARSGFSTSMPPAQGALRVVRTLRLDGAVYASPIDVNAITIVATEHDTVYGIDATGAVRWRAQLGQPSPAAERPCGNIDPLGVTGTPVYDAGTGTVFLAPEYGAPPRHELVALDARSGTVRWRTSIDLPGVDPAAMQERGALTVAGGRVWVPFGGLDGDCGAYKGRIVGVRTDGVGSPIAFTVPTSREGGIWAPPGPSVDARGALFVSVGNGAAGAGASYDGSDSVLAVGTDARLVSQFAPASWASDNDADRDLGSQGPAFVGSWVFIDGKSGIGYVLRHSDLGGIGGEVSSATVCTSFGGTAVVAGVVYVPCTDGVRAVRVDAAGQLHVLWRANSAITGSPVVGGGRIWTLDTAAGVLHALDPATGRTREQVAVGTTSRFATPAISGRDVLVPTLAGLTVVRTS